MVNVFVSNRYHILYHRTVFLCVLCAHIIEYWGSCMIHISITFLHILLDFLKGGNMLKQKPGHKDS